MTKEKKAARISPAALKALDRLSKSTDRLIAVQVSGEEVQLTLRSGNPLDVDLFGRTHRLDDRIVVPFAG